MTKLTKRNRTKHENELFERFPAVGSLEKLQKLVAEANTTEDAEAAVEAYLDSLSTGSKIKPKYKAKYAANGDPRSCGDDFAKAFAAMVTKTNLSGQQVCDVELLRKIADKNDAWQDKYSSLNIGMQRMNVGNRLRAKIKRGEKIWWPEKASFAA